MTEPFDANEFRRQRASGRSLNGPQAGFQPVPAQSAAYRPVAQPVHNRPAPHPTPVPAQGVNPAAPYRLRQTEYMPQRDAQGRPQTALQTDKSPTEAKKLNKDRPSRLLVFLGGLAVGSVLTFAGLIMSARSVEKSIDQKLANITPQFDVSETITDVSQPEAFSEVQRQLEGAKAQMDIAKGR